MTHPFMDELDDGMEAERRKKKAMTPPSPVPEARDAQAETIIWNVLAATQNSTAAEQTNRIVAALTAAGLLAPPEREFHEQQIRNRDKLIQDQQVALCKAPDNNGAREVVAAWMIAHSYPTGHGDTVEHLLAELVAHASAPVVPKAEGDMRAFGASDAACVLWPDDTAEHRELRAAYILGAADCGAKAEGDSGAEVERLRAEIRVLEETLREERHANSQFGAGV